MVKVSRPVIYSVVAAVAIYAVVLITEPEPPAKKPTKRTRASAALKAPAGFLPEDLTARFDRYTGKARNAFQPEVMPKQTVMNTLPGGRQTGDPNRLLAGPGRGAWALTGINILNGDRSALIENSTTGDSAFLKTGDTWNGLEVVAIEADTVVFLNTLGQRTQLKFVDPESETVPAPGTTILPGAVPGRTVITVTPINKNGITVTPGGVAPVIPALPALPALNGGGLSANVPPVRGGR